MCNMCNMYAKLEFETQRRHHQKSKTEVSVAPQKRLMPSKKIKIKVSEDECIPIVCILPA